MLDVERKNRSTLSILHGEKTSSQQQKRTTMESFMTMKEVGAYLRLSTQTVKRLIEAGRLAAHRIGRCSYRVPEDAVQALLTQTLTGERIHAPDAGLEQKKPEMTK
jgi:excisionase family DNA binding protein